MAAPVTQTKTPPTAPPFNPNKSPKQRYRENARWVGEHRTLVDSDAFVRACDMALLQYQQTTVANITNGDGAGAAGLRLQGAVDFLNTLRNLSETPPLTTRRPDDNLAH